ncbi:BTB/POZ domain-containing protein [Mycoplasma sp. VS276A1]
MGRFKKFLITSSIALGAIAGVSFIMVLIMANLEPTKIKLKFNNFSSPKPFDASTPQEEQLYLVSDKDQSNYFAHPDYMLKIQDGKPILYIAYVQGHGRGKQIIKKSYDLGKTWSKPLDLSKDFDYLQETPTIFELKKVDENGNYIEDKKIYLYASARPGWNSVINNGEGIDISLSNDLENWKPFENFFGPRAKRQKYNVSHGVWDAIVAFSTLVQLRDDKGKLLNKWNGYFHTYAGNIYQTTISFNNEEQLELSQPIEIKVSEGTNDFSEPCIIQNPSNPSESYMLVRSISRKAKGYLLHSNDNFKTWKNLGELPDTLSGERHKAIFHNGKFYISFRQISPKLFNNVFNKKIYSYGPMIWVGTFDNIKNGKGLLFKIGQTYDSGTKSFDDELANADTGYSGLAIYDNKLLYSTYGKFDPEDRNSTQIYSKIMDIDKLK